MKKISQRLIAAAVVAAVGASASAEVLSPEQALGRALPQARRAAPAISQPVLAYTAEADELPAVYVFAKENKGFLLVSADDAVTPLLGYADNGNFDAENMAPGFKYWIGEYARQIAYMRENGIDNAAPRIARPARAAIAPMVKTKWNQDAPYNLLCPAGKNNMRTYTGCVATAAAQVMKYHEYPAKGTGTFKYTSNVDGVSQELKLELDKVPLEWDKMLDTYTSSATEEEKMAVANLMVAIGYGVEMSYSTVGSGAQTIKVSQILTENFGYDKSVQYLQRDCYTLSEWEEIIYNQLQNVGPVLYDGSTINQEGHAFVCDGYDTDGLFHINWGWGGVSDGYFLLGTLDPEAQGAGGAASGAGFDYGQDATVNIMKDNGGKGTPMFTANGKGLLVTPEYFNVGSDVTVAYEGGGFYNHGYQTVDVTFGLHIVGEGQDFYRWAANPMTAIKTNYGAASYNVLLSGVKENSTYVITPVYKVDGEIYPMGMPYGKVRSYVVKTSVYNGELHPVGVGLEISELTVPEQINRNQKVKMSAVQSNTSDTYYYGHVAPVILEKEYGEYSIVKILTNYTLNLEPGESQTWEAELRFTNSVGLTDGTDYYLAFMDVSTESLISNLAKFHYGTVSGISDVTADNNGVVLTPNPADSYFTVQGAEVNTVSVYTLAGALAAQANEATVDVSNLAAGMYLVEVVAADGNRTTLRLIKK